MKKQRYYLGKLKHRLAAIFTRQRIKQFGLRIAVLDLIIFMCHRSASDFQLMVIREKDRLVQKYLYRNYENILANIEKNNYGKY